MIKTTISTVSDSNDLVQNGGQGDDKYLIVAEFVMGYFVQYFQVLVVIHRI